MTDFATALARVTALRDQAEDEIVSYAKGSQERLRQLERFRNLDALADAEMLADWLGDANFQARWIADPDEQEPDYIARLILEFCPLERVMDLASWKAGRPWWGDASNRVWKEDEAAIVRREMARAMVLHADLLNPGAPMQKAQSS